MKDIKLLSAALLLTCASSIAHADVKLAQGLQNFSSFERIEPTQLIPNVKNEIISDEPRYAQSSDPVRVMQLEEQVRRLSGQVEELNFQLLQMQEQMRRMQEDNEFRFQELEQNGALENKNDSVADNSDKDTRLGKSLPSEASKDAADGKSNTIVDLIEGNQNRKTIDGVEIFDPTKDKSADELGAKSGASFGSFKFDSNGNVIIDPNQQSVGSPLPLGGVNKSNEQLPDEPDALFDLGYQYVQAGQYEQSAQVFSQFSNNHVGHGRISDAQFWLGESYMALGRYEDAAKVFLQNHKDHPSAKLGAQNLLKLGVSLAGLNQRELACATYAEVPKKYPEISNSVKKRIEVEQLSAKCKN